MVLSEPDSQAVLLSRGEADCAVEVLKQYWEA